MDSDKIGSFIRNLRKDAGLSQYQLADKIPISRQAVSKWERGETIPDSSTLLRLSELFDVTINELLKGERIKHNTIKQLESTTLYLVDESNKKSRKIKNLVVTFIGVITILILIFLGYYFINSYNSIKVYKIYGKNKKFDFYDGMMIDSKQKTYLKLGKIKNNTNYPINNITLYYLSNKKEHVIANSSEDLEQVFIYKKGYTDIYLYNKLINNTYVRVNYNNNQHEIIKLDFRRDYSNSNLLFKQGFSRKKEVNNQQINNEITKENRDFNKEDSNNQAKYEEVSQIIESKEVNIEQMMEKAINKMESPKIDNSTNNTKEESEETQLDLIKRLGIPNSGNYVYVTTVNNKEIRFVYYTMMNQVMMYIDGVEEWNYLHYARIYRCNNIPNNTDDCKKYVNDTINSYIK